MKTIFLSFCLFFCLLLLPDELRAQTGGDSLRTIQGTALDAETWDPLAGASIRIYRQSGDSLLPTPHGAVVRSDGSFSVALPYQDDTLLMEATYIGYRSSRITLEPGAPEVDFLLEQGDRLEPAVHVTAARRTRSVEDACCRVESIREEVQQHAPFSPGVADVLSRYSSCTSLRVSCAIDNSSFIRLRGLEPTYIKVLMDGMPAFTGLSAFYGLSLVPSHALQTIRISEGASSGLYGNGAISGVIDLETRPPTEIPEITLSGNMAVHGVERPEQGDLNLAYTGMLGEVGIAAFGSLNMHDPITEAGGIGRGYDRFSGLIKGNMLLDDATELIVSALLGREQRTGTHLGTETGTPEHREDITLGRGDFSMKLARTLDEESEIVAAGLLSLQSLDATYGAYPLDARQRTTYLNLKYSRTIGDHLLLVGGEVFSDRLSEKSGRGIGYDLTIPSLFAQDELLLADEWTVMASLRADRHPFAGTIVTPRGSIKYSPLSTMTMRLMAGGGFKGEALFNEEHLTLHGTYRWRPNNDLAFERSFTLNYDVSYSFLIGDQGGMDANFNTYYTTITGKAIPQADSLAAGTLFYVNSSRPGRLAGLELQLRPTFGEHWSGSFALALISYTLQDAAGIYQQMPLAPRMNVDASLMYHDDGSGVTAETWGSYIGAQKLPANPFGAGESSPYILLNLRGEKAFGPVAIFAGVFNLLDARQINTMPLSFETRGTENGGMIWGPLEGREFFVGARLSWGGSAE